MLRTNPSILSEMCRSAQRVLISIATLLVVLGCSDRGGGSGGGGGGNGGGDSNAAPYISRIELIPANPVMLPNQNLQIQAVAWMSDGSSKDAERGHHRGRGPRSRPALDHGIGRDQNRGRKCIRGDTLFHRNQLRAHQRAEGRSAAAHRHGRL